METAKRPSERSARWMALNVSRETGPTGARDPRQSDCRVLVDGRTHKCSVHHFKKRAPPLRGASVDKANVCATSWSVRSGSMGSPSKGRSPITLECRSSSAGSEVLLGSVTRRFT